MVTRKWFGLLFMSLIAINHGLFSQILLDGVVIDNGSEPVKNALVEFMDQADPTQVFRDYTDDSGLYTIPIITTGIHDPESRNPGNFKLRQNYPNPFSGNRTDNPTTSIVYELSQPSHVRIEIRNILGQKV